MLHTVCQAISTSLDRLPGGHLARIGIITFDSSVHFYHIKPTHSEPHMLVVSDVNDMFVPLPQAMLVRLRAILVC